MKKRFTFLMAAVMLLAFLTVPMGMRGQSNTSTLTFTAKCNGSGTADDDAEWTVTSDGTESNFDDTKGIHYGTNSAQVEYIQLSTSDISGTITKVVVNASTASGVSATVGVTVGGSAFGGDPQSLTTSAANYTFTGSASGEIVVLITKPSKATKALYCKSIEVTYTPSGAPTYTVTYNANGGTIGSAPTDATAYSNGDAVTVANRNTLDHETLGFKGWNTQADGEGTFYNPGESFSMGSANVNLYAVWSTRCTFEYDGNGYTDGDIPSSYYTSYGTGAKVVVMGNTGDLVKTAAAWDGWNTANDGTGTTYQEDDSFTITSNTILYAKWRDLATYTLVTSVDQLVTGKHYVIASSGANGDAYAMGYDKGNNRDAVAVSITNHTIEEKDEVWDFVISGHSNNWTFYDRYTDGGYLYAAHSSSNYLKTDDDLNTLGDNYKWSITIASDGAATIVAQGTNTHNYMRFNTGSPKLFSCYAPDGSVKNPVYLYVQNNDNDCHIYSTTDISSNMTVTGDMNIHEAGWVTVKNGATLTVEGTITNIVAADLVIEDGGQLKTNNAVQKATVKKNIAKWSAGDVFGWYFIASPINSNSLDPSTVGNMITPDASSEHTYDLYRLDMSATDGKEWRNYRASSFNLVNGMGYLYANYNNDTLNFSGAILPTNETKEVTGLKANDYNLVGNPYTCNAYVNTAYYTINDAYNGITAETSTSSSAIAPCTGIIVKTAAEVTTVKFGTSTPVTSANHGNIKMVLAQQVATRGESNEQTIDNAIVSFNEGEVLPKFYFGTQNANIYIPQGDKEYAIVSAEPFGTIPVNFRAEKDGQYTLNIGVEEAEMNYLHLIDNMTGADVDLLVNPSYTFNARNNDYESRFKLVFSSSNTDETEAESDFAFISNGNLIVAGTGTLQIVDMMGRTIGSYSTSDLISTSDLAQGVYVLRLVNGDNVKTQKIVVK